MYSYMYMHGVGLKDYRRCLSYLRFVLQGIREVINYIRRFQA